MNKLNDSKHISETSLDESLSNSKLADTDSVEKFDSKLQEDTHLNNQKSKNESASSSTSFNTENTDLSQMLKSNSSTDLGIDT